VTAQITQTQPPGPRPARRRSLWARLGVPIAPGSGGFVAATGIDSVGTGLVLAFTVVYFVDTTTVGLARIGAVMTLARLLALPTSMTVGPLIDRFTARRTAAAGNLLSAGAYVGFLGARNVWTIGIVVFLVQVGHTTYWTSNGALIAVSAPPDARTRWFGFIHAVRNTGLGVGAALGAVGLAIGSVTGLRAIAVGDAASFVVAAALLGAWRPARTGREADREDDAAPPPDDGAGGGHGRDGYLAVLRDRRYGLLIAVNCTLVFAQMLIKVLLAIYVVEALRRGAWIAGVLIVTATVQIALTQNAVTRWLEPFRRTRAVAAASLLDAAAFGLFALLYVAPGALVVAGLVLAMAVFTIGEEAGFPAMDSLSVSMAPARIRGRYLAVFQLSWTLGEIAAPGVLTLLLATQAVAPMLFLLALSLLALPLLALLERTSPSVRPETTGAS
jgi:MFS family permease